MYIIIELSVKPDLTGMRLIATVCEIFSRVRLKAVLK